MINPLTSLALLLLGGSREKALAQLAEGMDTSSFLHVLRNSKLLPDEMASFLTELGDLRETSVREIMVPRTSMICIPEETTPEEAIALSVAQGFSRYPVYQGGIDHIVGILHAKDLLPFGLGKKVEIRKAMRTPFFVPETKKVFDLLRDLQGRKIHMSIVLDEYGGVAGLLTMEDLLEQVFGEIQDEFDDGETQEIVPLPDGGWEVTGGLEVRDLEDLLGVPVDRRGFDTVGGLILERLGRMPKPGDEVRLEGYTLTVGRLDGHQITRVKIVSSPVPESPEESHGAD